jgi:hypothetical protein
VRDSAVHKTEVKLTHLKKNTMVAKDVAVLSLQVNLVTASHESHNKASDIYHDIIVIGFAFPRKKEPNVRQATHFCPCL